MNFNNNQVQQFLDQLPQAHHPPVTDLGPFGALIVVIHLFGNVVRHNPRVDGRFAQIIRDNLLAQMPNGTVAVGAEFGGVTLTPEVWEAIGDALNGRAGNISSLFINGILDRMDENEAIRILNTIAMTFGDSPLNTLNVQNIALPPLAFHALAPLLGPNLISIAMIFCGLADDQMLFLVQCLNGAVHLRTAKFDRNYNLTDRSASLIAGMITGNHALLELTVSGCNFGKAGARSVCAGLGNVGRNVTTIDLSGSNLGDGFDPNHDGIFLLCEALANFPHLEILRLGDTAMGIVGTSRLAMAIAQHAPPLRELSLEACANLESLTVTSPFLESFVAMLLAIQGTLEQLNLGHLEFTGDVAAVIFGTCGNSLRVLEFEGNQVSMAAAQVLIAQPLHPDLSIILGETPQDVADWLLGHLNPNNFQYDHMEEDEEEEEDYTNI